MSFEAMHKVRASGLTDRTQVDVLEALAFFLNQETGACFPSTESIARISRVNDRLVRTTLKALHDLGYVSSIQTPGQRRYFTLHLDKLPTAELLKESTPLQEPTPPNKNTPLYETTALHESTGEGGMKVQGTPVEKCSTPLYETTPEQVIKKEFNKVSKKVYDAPASDDLFTNDCQMIEKPKKKPTDRGSRLTIDALPDDWKAFAEAEEPDLDPYRLFDNFKDYWTSVSGAKAIKKDWTATWRNFVRSFNNAPDWKRRPMLKNGVNPNRKPTDPQYGIGVCQPIPDEEVHWLTDEERAESRRQMEAEGYAPF